MYNMEIIKYPGREEWSSLIKRPALDVTTLFDTVRTVLDEVREQGDTAVISRSSMPHSVSKERKWRLPRESLVGRKR